MAKIESPLGTRVEDSVAMRTFTVEDNSFDEPKNQREITPEEVNALRRAKFSENNTVSSSAKRRVEMLVGMGRMFRECAVKTNTGTTIFTLRSLKSKEMKFLSELAQEAALNNQVGGIFRIRATTLACAITAIDGVDVDVVLDCTGKSSEEKFRVRLAVLDEMDESVLAYLHGEYQKMIEDHVKQFGIKTEQDAMEVAADIKKSG